MKRTPKISNVVVFKTSDKISFTLSNVRTSEANRLRQAMYKIPTYALDCIEIIFNDSVLQDEEIASRIGLIPIIASPSEINEGRVFTFEIDVTATEDVVTVQSDSFVSTCLETDTSVYSPSVMGGIDVVKLKNGQRLAVRCKAVIGTGDKDMKWVPVCRSVYSMSEPRDNLSESRVFNFEVESVGGMKAEDILLSALKNIYG